MVVVIDVMLLLHFNQYDATINLVGGCFADWLGFLRDAMLLSRPSPVRKLYERLRLVSRYIPSILTLFVLHIACKVCFRVVIVRMAMRF